MSECISECCYHQYTIGGRRLKCVRHGRGKISSGVDFKRHGIRRRTGPIAYRQRNSIYKRLPFTRRNDNFQYIHQNSRLMRNSYTLTDRVPFPIRWRYAFGARRDSNPRKKACTALFVSISVAYAQGIARRTAVKKTHAY